LEFRKNHGYDVKILSDLFDDYSGARIERVVRKAINKMVLNQNESLTIQDLEYSISH